MVKGKKKVVSGAAKKAKTSARSTSAAKAFLEEDFEGMLRAENSVVDLMYVHYEKKQKGYEIFVSPQVVRMFWEEYGIELEYNPELKVFVGTIKALPKAGVISFVEYNNHAISAKALNQAQTVRQSLETLDREMDALKEQHDELRKQAIGIVLEHGIKTKKGRVAHKKILTGNWVTSVRQLIPDVSLKTPNLPEVQELIEMFPQHKKQLKKLTENTTKCYEVQDIDEENLFEVVRKINKHKVTDIKIMFKSSDAVDESSLPNCFSWDDMDLDIDQTERLINNLPFEVKLELYNLPEIDDNPLQFHYKTDQKTDPDCVYCGGEFLKNTNKCCECGLNSFKMVKNKKEKLK